MLSDAGLDPTDLHNVATLTLLVGVVMVVFGALRLGAAMSFVSNAVMTGFTTGIALQIVAGVASDATGYAPDVHNTIGKIGQTLIHLPDWDAVTTVVTAATVGVWAAAHAVPRLQAMATLIALLLVSLGVGVLDLDVEKVGDIGSIPNAFPAPVLPDLSVAPDLVFGAVAVALVALAQAAGIGAAVPNPDGSRTNVSGDFLAQGAANLAGGFFRALPVGGSLSRTGVATSAGARTRWAGIFAGISLAVLVIVAGSAAEQIPMPVIGGLILVIGTELIVGRMDDIVFVARTALLPVLAMVTTFLATTQLPLQQAIFVGVALSLLLYCVSAQRHTRLQALARQDDGHWRVVDVPRQLPSRRGHRPALRRRGLLRRAGPDRRGLARAARHRARGGHPAPARPPRRPVLDPAPGARPPPRGARGAGLPVDRRGSPPGPARRLPSHRARDPARRGQPAGADPGLLRGARHRVEPSERLARRTP